MTPPQRTLLGGMIALALLGAIALAFALRWWNGRI